jgi:putative tryptophan/tyrosine transport system substrate-binding protein
MRRRDLTAILVAATLMPLAAAAQQSLKVRSVGILAPGPLHPIASFKQRLRELGWIEGLNIRFEERWAEGDDTVYPTFAAELAALPVDAILTWSTPAVLAAKRATTVIPIIMAAVGDPVVIGAVPGLARPGGNITGFSSQSLQLEEKRFQLLRELVPGLSTMVMLGNAANPYTALAMKRVNDLAEASGVHFEGIDIDTAGGLVSGLDALSRARPEGVLVSAAPALFPYRKPIVDFMAANRLPAVYPLREFAEAGGLLAYSTNFDDLFRAAADYVDRVLKGARPRELPVQQATTFELLVNLGAAKTLGIEIPPSILARADRVIE